MSDRPADPDGEGPAHTGPKPSIADVASWLRRAAEERETIRDPSPREGAAAGAEDGTEASTPSTTGAGEPEAEAEGRTDRPAVPTDHGGGAPDDPGREGSDDQVVTGAAPAPEAPAVLRPPGSAVRPARDLWGRLLPVEVVGAGTDDSAGRLQSDPSTSAGDQTLTATQRDVARTDAGHEGLAATGLGGAAGAGTYQAPTGQTASSSHGIPADAVGPPLAPAADDLGAAGRTPTADRPGPGVAGWGGGARPGHVLPEPAGPSDPALADSPLRDSPPGGTPPSHGPLGHAVAGDDRDLGQARGGDHDGRPVGLVPEDPVRDDRSGGDQGDPLDRDGPASDGLQHRVGAGGLVEATPEGRGQDGQGAGDGDPDELPVPDLVQSRGATADTGPDAAQPADVVTVPDDQDQARQGPAGGDVDEPATQLVPSDRGEGYAVPGPPDSLDPAPDPPAVDGQGPPAPADGLGPDRPSPPDDTSSASGRPSPWTSPSRNDATRSAYDGTGAPGSGATGQAASDSPLGDESRSGASSEAAAEAELRPPVEADPRGTVDGDQEGGPAAGGAAHGDGREGGQTPEAGPSTESGTTSAPFDLGQAWPAAPRLAGIWTRPAPPTPVDVEDDTADREGRRDNATERNGRGEQATVSAAPEADERPSAASDDVDDPAGSEATASVATLERGEDGPADPEWSAGADGGIVTGDVQMDDDDDVAAAEPKPQIPMATAVAELRRRHAAKRKRYPRGQLKERIGILQRVRAMLGVVLLTVLLGVAAGAAIGAFLFFVAFAIRSAITSS